MPTIAMATRENVFIGMLLWIAGDYTQAADRFTAGRGASVPTEASPPTPAMKPQPA
jgi:hypothetical protein